MKKLIISVLISALFIISNNSVYAWDDCPFGLEDDPYPGECSRYIDTNDDGICDHSQSEPTEESTETETTEEEAVTEDSSEEVEEHEELYSVEIEGTEMKLLTIEEIANLWEIDANELLKGIVNEFDLEESYETSDILNTLRDEYKFSPALVKDIAEEIKTGNSDVTEINTTEQTTIRESPYNFAIPFFTTLILYIISWFAAERKLFSKYTHPTHNMIWNTLLLVALIPSAIFGFYLTLRYPFPEIRIDREVFDFLYWHVEGSIVMGTISIMHLLQRLKMYFSQIKCVKENLEKCEK